MNKLLHPHVQSPEALFEKTPKPPPALRCPSTYKEMKYAKNLLRKTKTSHRPMVRKYILVRSELKPYSRNCGTSL